MYTFRLKSEVGANGILVHDRGFAANAYFCRWSVVVVFQDVKLCFSIEAHDIAVGHGMRQLFRDVFKAYGVTASEWRRQMES